MPPARPTARDRAALRALLLTTVPGALPLTYPASLGAGLTAVGCCALDDPAAPVAEVLARVAQANNVTHLVMGESARSRLEEIRRGSLVRQVLSASRGIDVYIVADPA
jgi:hypothetical protein